MNMNTLFKSINLLVVVAVIAFSCNDKDTEGSGMARVQVSLVDAPADYDEVNVEIEEVAIKSGDGEDNWIVLDDAETGIFDLLELTNGNEVFLGEAMLPAGELSEIRLILGDDNTLVVDGQTLDLTIPSGSQSGLKVKVDADIEGGVTYKLVLDFDAARSVVKAGNSGNYNLKPVVRAEMEALTGAIEGVIDPIDANAVIYAIDVDTAASTYPASDGSFLLRALGAGTYSVVVSPGESLDFDTLTMEDVSVTVGQVTKVDTLKLVTAE